MIYRLDVGGLENGLVNIINRLPADKFRHAIICMTDYSDFSQRIEPPVELIALHKKPGKDIALYWRLYQAFRHIRPDIVHTRNLTTLEAQLMAWLARVPYRIHGLHGWDVHDLRGENKRYQKLYRFIDHFINCYIPLSDDLEKYLVKIIGVNPQKINKICNGVDTDLFSPAESHPNFDEKDNGKISPDTKEHHSSWQSLRAMPPRENWVKGAQIIVGTVGRLEIVKDQLNLVRAFILLMENHPWLRDKARLILVGEGTLRPQLEQLLEESGLSDLVWLVGASNEVSEFMRLMDIFVLPSKAEGISNTILEAMATGLPVVATRVGGNAQLIIDGETGKLVPKEDPQALAAALYEYLSQPHLIVRQGNAARQRAIDCFSLDQMVSQYQKVYQKCG